MAVLSRVIIQRCRSVLGCYSLLKLVLINSRISRFNGRCSLGFQSSSGDLFLCIAVFPSWSNGCNTSVTPPTLWFTEVNASPLQVVRFLCWSSKHVSSYRLLPSASHFLSHDNFYNSLTSFSASYRFIPARAGTFTACALILGSASYATSLRVYLRVSSYAFDFIRKFLQNSFGRHLLCFAFNCTKN